jgi:hypothetical protein
MSNKARIAIFQGIYLKIKVIAYQVLELTFQLYNFIINNLKHVQFALFYSPYLALYFILKK